MTAPPIFAHRTRAPFACAPRGQKKWIGYRGYEDDPATREIAALALARLRPWRPGMMVRWWYPGIGWVPKSGVFPMVKTGPAPDDSEGPQP